MTLCDLTTWGVWPWYVCRTGSDETLLLFNARPALCCLVSCAPRVSRVGSNSRPKKRTLRADWPGGGVGVGGGGEGEVVSSSEHFVPAIWLFFSFVFLFFLLFLFVFFLLPCFVFNFFFFYNYLSVSPPCLPAVRRR